jgi:hypothetical protein
MFYSELAALALASKRFDDTSLIGRCNSLIWPINSLFRRRIFTIKHLISLQFFDHRPGLFPVLSLLPGNSMTVRRSRRVPAFVPQ